MPQYQVVLKTYAFVTFDVEADNADEAADLAADLEAPQLCAQCSGWNNWDPSLELSEAWETDMVYKVDEPASSD